MWAFGTDPNYFLYVHSQFQAEDIPSTEYAVTPQDFSPDRAHHCLRVRDLRNCD